MSSSSLPDTFKAAILRELNQPLELISIKMPCPKRGQVLVKIKMAGICRSQLMEAKGMRGKNNYLPHMMGHEAVAEVIKVGNGVTKVKAGNRVILTWIKSEGIDAGGSILESEDGQTINAGPITTFSEYSLVSENRVVVCPHHLPDYLAVMLGCALPTGAGMVINQVSPRPNSTILLIGLGGIGLSALLMLRLYSAKHLVVVDTEQHKLDLAKKLGATDTILYRHNVKTDLQSNYPEGFDYAIECAGLCKTIELAFELLNNKGVCYFASHPKSGEKISLDPHQLISGKQIFGTWGGGCSPDIDLEKIGKTVFESGITMSELNVKSFSLKKINQAFSELESKNITRALIEIN